jgi:hypothetical protein
MAVFLGSEERLEKRGQRLATPAPHSAKKFLLPETGEAI